MCFPLFHWSVLDCEELFIHKLGPGASYEEGGPRNGFHWKKDARVARRAISLRTFLLPGPQYWFRGRPGEGWALGRPEFWNLSLFKWKCPASMWGGERQVICAEVGCHHGVQVETFEADFAKPDRQLGGYHGS